MLDLKFGFYAEFHRWGRIPRSNSLHPGQSMRRTFVFEVVFLLNWFMGLGSWSISLHLGDGSCETCPAAIQYPACYNASKR